MSWKATRLTKPWRQLGNEAVYQLSDGDYAITGDRMPIVQVWSLNMAEDMNETTIRLPGEIVDEFIAGYLNARRVRRERWLPREWFAKLKSKLSLT